MRGGAGGGACQHVDVWKCTITANIAPGASAAFGSRLFYSDISSNHPPNVTPWDNAAVVNSYIDHCRIAVNLGGGVSGGSVIKNSLIAGNSGAYGGVDRSSVENCTIIFNARYNQVGGLYGGSARNSIIYHNFMAPDQFGHEFANADLSFCCSSVLAPGPGNFTNAPQFANWDGSDYRLQSNSPCINAGDNDAVTGLTDLDGQPRVAGGTVDVGAYEFASPASVISYAWLSQYRLPQDGSADYLDSDEDGMNNWQEWRALTIPTNGASLLWMLDPVPNATGVTVRWLSSSNVLYSVERANQPAAGSGYQVIGSNLTGGSGVFSFVDTNSPLSSLQFYRVRVQ